MEEKEFDYINVIPFIDIMLVLLTIVLTTSAFIAQGTIPMELPRVSSTERASTLKTISVEIDRSGKLYLNSSCVSLSELNQSVRLFSPQTPVMIRADREIALQMFVDVMDVIKNAGFKKLSLQTEVKK
jgi:biopolymer transport protein ExbD